MAKQTKVLTIMFADMVGSTRLSSALKRGEDLSIKEELRSLFEEFAEEYDGRVVKTVGDGYMLAFDSPTDAVLCGKAIQEDLKNWNEESIPDIDFRIGIHTGEVTVNDEGDLFGREVNVASRIESAANPGGVYFSETTFGAMNKSELNFEFLGDKKLKGIEGKIGINRVIPEGQTPINLKMRWWKKVGAIGCVILLGLVGLGWAVNQYYDISSPNNLFSTSVNLEAISWEKAGEFVGETKAIRGTVVEVKKVKPNIYINFGRNSGDFSAKIYEAEWSKFPSVKVLRERLVGQAVYVKGEISKYDDQPQMDLFSPSQVQLLSKNKSMINWSEAGEYVGEKKTVQGEIVNTYESGGARFLFFGNDPGDFHGVVFDPDWEKFNSFEYYEGEQVRITGTIKKYKESPRIILESPKQIEVVE